MSGYKEEIAGVGIIGLALLLAYNGEYEKAMMLVLPLLAFFVGEKNGAKSVGEEGD